MFYKLDFLTEYNQFYLSSDNRSEMNLINSFILDGYTDRLTNFNNTLIIRTETYGHVVGEINILQQALNFDQSKYDHIVEAGIDINSGLLEVINCPYGDIELQIKLIPSTYRVRIYFSNMLGYDHDEDKLDDFIKIEIYPEDNKERKVIKRYLKP